MIKYWISIWFTSVLSPLPANDQRLFASTPKTQWPLQGNDRAGYEPSVEEWDNRLNVEDILDPVIRAIIKTGIILKREAQEIPQRVLGDFGQFFICFLG
ncbi:MAG: hypothetical protein WCK92_07070 [Bacteroidota bacterium]